MTRYTADYNPRNINRYVPNMTFSADVDENGRVRTTLGAPATADADFFVTSVLLVSGTAKSCTIANDTVVARYGRNVTITADAACTRVATVKGRDYVGQPMTETITFNGNATVAGKKAFKYVDSVDISAVADTPNITVGFGDVLGLPYKAVQLAFAMEDGDPADDEVSVHPLVASSLAIADAASATFTAPFDGYIIGWEGVYTTAMTTASSAITAHVGGVAKTNGDGVAPIGAIGAKFGKNIAKADWIPVAKGDTVLLTSDGGGTAGVAIMTMFFSREVGIFTPGVSTDPQTATTGDPRGTYDPGLACNGSREFIVDLIVDTADLHGVEHYYA